MDKHEHKRRKLRKGHPHWKHGHNCTCGFVSHLVDVPDRPEGEPPQAADPVTDDPGVNLSKVDHWDL